MRKLLFIFSFVFLSFMLFADNSCPVCYGNHAFTVKHYINTELDQNNPQHYVFCSTYGWEVDIGGCWYKDTTQCSVAACSCCGPQCPYTVDCTIVNCTKNGSITYCKKHKPNCVVTTCPDCKKSYCETHGAAHECACPNLSSCAPTHCDKCDKNYCATHKSPHECKCPYQPGCSQWTCDVCTGKFCAKHQNHGNWIGTCPVGATHQTCGTPPVSPPFQVMVCKLCMRTRCSICPHDCECPSVECSFHTCKKCGARICNLHPAVHICPDPPTPPTPPDDPNTIPPTNPNPDVPPTPNTPSTPKPQTPPNPGTNPNVPSVPTPEPEPQKPSIPEQRPEPKTPETPAPGPVTVPGGGGGGGSGTTDFGSFSGENVNIQSYMLGQGENVVELPTYDYKKTGVDESKFDWIGDKLHVSGAVAPVISIPLPDILGCADLVIDFNNQTVARIVRIFRNFLSGILYIGAIIVFVKIIRTFEF